MSQEGSEIVVVGDVFIMVALFHEEAAFLALFCAVGTGAMVSLLEFQALFARVLGPTSSGAPPSSGLSRLRATEGDSMVGRLRPATVIGMEEGGPIVGWLVLGTEDELERAA